jgi:hypothetical protein
MFSWSQSSSESDNTTVVSNRFWIYWAVTIPLTLLTIVIWRLWWLWQERSYQKEVEQAVGDSLQDEKPPAKEWHPTKSWRRHFAADASSTLWPGDSTFPEVSRWDPVPQQTLNGRSPPMATTPT